jgi:hypothetical protein
MRSYFSKPHVIDEELLVYIEDAAIPIGEGERVLFFEKDIPDAVRSLFLAVMGVNGVSGAALVGKGGRVCLHIQKLRDSPYVWDEITKGVARALEGAWGFEPCRT